MTLQNAEEAGDSTPESRTSAPPNRRPVVAVAAKPGVGPGTDGSPICRGDVVDEAYGKATSNRLNSADDGVDDLDCTAFYAAFSNGDPEADLNLDDVRCVHGLTSLMKTSTYQELLIFTATNRLEEYGQTMTADMASHPWFFEIKRETVYVN